MTSMLLSLRRERTNLVEVGLPVKEAVVFASVPHSHVTRVRADVQSAVAPVLQ